MWKSLLYTEASLPIAGIVEGIYRTTLYREGGHYHTPWGDYDVMEGPGIALAGRDLVALDASAFRLLGLDPEERTFIRLGRQVFGEGETKAIPPIPEEMRQLFVSGSR